MIIKRKTPHRGQPCGGESRVITHRNNDPFKIYSISESGGIPDICKDCKGAELLSCKPYSRKDRNGYFVRPGDPWLYQDTQEWLKHLRKIYKNDRENYMIQTYEGMLEEFRIKRLLRQASDGFHLDPVDGIIWQSDCLALHVLDQVEIALGKLFRAKLPFEHLCEILHIIDNVPWPKNNKRILDKEILPCFRSVKAVRGEL